MLFILNVIYNRDSQFPTLCTSVRHTKADHDKAASKMCAISVLVRLSQTDLLRALALS